MVKKGDETLRITVTSANTEAEVDALLTAFGIVGDYLRSVGASLVPAV
jgi:7-keto-8-aminopelargonate synthetase-like enzyme